MRIAIDHSWTVTFAKTLPRTALALRVHPEDSDSQTVARWQIGPDCDARMRDGRDGYGNVLTMLYVEGPIDSIEVHVWGEVFTGPSSGILSSGHAEPLPPSLFLRPSLALADAPDMAALAVEAAQDAKGEIDRLHLLNVTLHKRSGEVDDGALAEMFVAAARRLGVPARCVSGYLAQGEGSVPHYWAEAHVAEIGWIGFDPATGLSAGEDHARVASALDLAGVAAVTGGPALR